MPDEQKQPILSRLSPPKGSVKPKRRLGRGPGSGLGTTAGKGQKGQLARGGGQVRPGYEGGQTPLYRRLPKTGFYNPFAKEVATVNLSSLGRFKAGETVDPDKLVESGVVRRKFELLKVLGGGKLEKALTVRAHAFSASAKAQIEQAGGKAELIETKKPEETAGA